MGSSDPIVDADSFFNLPSGGGDDDEDDSDDPRF
jgi:hypothetical protein